MTERRASSQGCAETTAVRRLDAFDWFLIATAKVIAAKVFNRSIELSDLVAAYRTLIKFEWIGRMDPDTCYTARPTSWTPAEQVIACVERESRRDGLELVLTATDWAAIDTLAAEIAARSPSDWNNAEDRTLDGSSLLDGQTVDEWRAIRATDEQTAIAQIARDRAQMERMARETAAA
ncbi:MAG: hypothetical protein OXG35_21340 [Acidobacteria bacterium]|nr:hypothetical protein [Acidobacteriota bacterium]